MAEFLDTVKAGSSGDHGSLSHLGLLSLSLEGVTEGL